MFLRCCGELDKGRVVEVRGAELSIGRRETCQLHYSDTTISSVHCKLFTQVHQRSGAVEWWLEDCSSNGTFVNDEKVGKGKSTKLCHKDSISLLKPTNGAEPPPYAYVISLTQQDGRETANTKRGKEQGAHASSHAPSSPPPMKLSSEEAIQLAMSNAKGAPPVAGRAPRLAMDDDDDDDGVAGATATRPPPGGANGAAPPRPPLPPAPTDSASQARLLAAVEEAVTDANKQAEVVRLQAVETAAQAVATHWKGTLDAALADAAATAEKKQAAAIEAALAEARELEKPRIDAAIEQGREAALAEAAGKQAQAVAEAVASEKEWFKTEHLKGLTAADDKAQQRLAAAVAAAREEAQGETAALLEARERSLEAGQLAVAAEREVSVHKEVSSAVESARLEAGITQRAAVEGAVQEVRERYERQIRHQAEANERAMKLAVQQAEERAADGFKARVEGVREECNRAASARLLEKQQEALRATEQAASEAAAVAVAREGEKLRVFREEAKEAQR